MLNYQGPCMKPQALSRKRRRLPGLQPGNWLFCECRLQGLADCDPDIGLGTSRGVYREKPESPNRLNAECDFWSTKLRRFPGSWISREPCRGDLQFEVSIRQQTEEVTCRSQTSGRKNLCRNLIKKPWAYNPKIVGFI